MFLMENIFQHLWHTLNEMKTIDDARIRTVDLYLAAEVTALTTMSAFMASKMF